MVATHGCAGAQPLQRTQQPSSAVYQYARRCLRSPRGEPARRCKLVHSQEQREACRVSATPCPVPCTSRQGQALPGSRADSALLRLSALSFGPTPRTEPLSTLLFHAFAAARSGQSQLGRLLQMLPKTAFQQIARLQPTAEKRALSLHITVHTGHIPAAAEATIHLSQCSPSSSARSLHCRPKSLTRLLGRRDDAESSRGPSQKAASLTPAILTPAPDIQKGRKCIEDRARTHSIELWNDARVRRCVPTACVW